MNLDDQVRITHVNQIKVGTLQVFIKIFRQLLAFVMKINAMVQVKLQESTKPKKMLLESTVVFLN